MERHALVALSMIAGHLAVATASAAAAEPPRRGTVRVVGEGRASLAPDLAVAFLGVEVEAPDLSAATSDANQRMRRVLEALSAAGVAKKDVQTSRYDVSPERRPDPHGGVGPISGYRVATEARVAIRDLAQVGRVLDAAVKAGANSTRGPTFQKADPSPERNQALAAAVADARAKAEILARSAGRELGEVLEITEGGQPRPVPLAGLRLMAAASSAAPVEPGELELSVRVEIEYALR